MSPPCTAERRHGALLHRRRRRRANRDRHGARGRRNHRRRVRRSDDRAVLIAAEVPSPTATATAPRTAHPSDRQRKQSRQRAARPTSADVRTWVGAKSVDRDRPTARTATTTDPKSDPTASTTELREATASATDSTHCGEHDAALRVRTPGATTARERHRRTARNTARAEVPHRSRRRPAAARSERRARALRGLDASNLHPIAHAHTDSWHRTTPLPAPTDRPRRLRRPDSTTS